MPPEILGPLGATVLLGIAVIALWRDHLRADADDRARSIEDRKRLDVSIGVSAGQVAATNRLADVIEERDRLAAARGRQTDS